MCLTNNTQGLAEWNYKCLTLAVSKSYHLYIISNLIIPRLRIPAILISRFLLDLRGLANHETRSSSLDNTTLSFNDVHTTMVVDFGGSTVHEADDGTELEALAPHRNHGRFHSITSTGNFSQNFPKYHSDIVLDTQCSNLV